MKITRIYLLILLLILVLPIFSVFGLSLLSSEGLSLELYEMILNSDDFRSSFILSSYTSVVTAVFATACSFFLALAWFSRSQRIGVVWLLVVLALIPTDITALAISKTFQLFGVKSSNLLTLIVGLIFYTLPYSIIFFLLRFYYLDKSMIIAARDIGMNRFSIISRLIFPLSQTSMLSAFIFSFLLAFNSYSMPYYLSGSNTLLSEFMYGKLSSGTNNSIYAGAAFVVTLVFVLLLIWSRTLKGKVLQQ